MDENIRKRIVFGIGIACGFIGMLFSLLAMIKPDAFSIYFDDELSINLSNSVHSKLGMTAIGGLVGFIFAFVVTALSIVFAYLTLSNKYLTIILEITVLVLGIAVIGISIAAFACGTIIYDGGTIVSN